MQYVIAAARNIGVRMTESKVIVDKSTVPVGTANRVRETIAVELARRGLDLSFAVASNPDLSGHALRRLAWALESSQIALMVLIAGVLATRYRRILPSVSSSATARNVPIRWPVS